MRVEWITVGMIGLAYSGWVLAGWLIWPVYPWLALAVMAVLTALHSSLVHEVVHGHPTRKRAINELMVGASLALIWPYRRFRAVHLKHHHDAHLTDPFEDPESYYRALWQVQMMPPLAAGYSAVEQHHDWPGDHRPGAGRHRPDLSVTSR